MSIVATITMPYSAVYIVIDIDDFAFEMPSPTLCDYNCTMDTIWEKTWK